MIRETAAVILIGFGVFCCVVSMIGVYRFDYILSRIHAAAVTDTLGTLLIFAGAILLKGPGWACLKILLILVFQWITGPVSTHRIGKVEVMTNQDYARFCHVEEGVLSEKTRGSRKAASEPEEVCGEQEEVKA